MINISEYDKTFSESTFKSKVDNIFIMFLTSITLQDLSRVDHFISDEIYNNCVNKVNCLQQRNERQMYDELNVKSTQIISSEIINDKIVVNVLIISRYMDYLIDKSTGKYISGNNRSRIEKNNYLTLEKRLCSKELGISRKCPNCNANIDINRSGKCEYCGTIFNEEDYDWVITKMS